MDTTAFVEPYGLIPRPVAEVCRLTFYCTDQDVHPSTAGYQMIAARVLSAAKSK